MASSHDIIKFHSMRIALEILQKMVDEAKTPSEVEDLCDRFKKLVSQLGSIDGIASAIIKPCEYKTYPYNIQEPIQCLKKNIGVALEYVNKKLEVLEKIKTKVVEQANS